jgi:hypothetical protein
MQQVGGIDRLFYIVSLLRLLPPAVFCSARAAQYASTSNAATSAPLQMRITHASEEACLLLRVCRTTFVCSLTFSTILSEPGEVAWMLLPAAGLNSTLLTSEQLMAGSSNLTGLAHGAIGTVNASTTAPDLPDQTVYVLVLAARDAAPVPNYVLQPVQLQLTAPDVTPPNFTGKCFYELHQAAALAGWSSFFMLLAGLLHVNHWRCKHVQTAVAKKRARHNSAHPNDH